MMKKLYVLNFMIKAKGINLKDSEKIFERFYSDRQDNIKNHTGLGLSIAKRNNNPHEWQTYFG